MNIERNGTTIELTADEVEEVYREQLKNYRKQDAARHLNDMFGDEPEKFAQEYGVELGDLMADDGFLDVAVERFEDDFDCNISENMMWENVITNVLAEMRGYDG